MTDPNEEQEIFDCIDWSTESNYTGYEDEYEDEEDWERLVELNREFDELLTDVNMGT